MNEDGTVDVADISTVIDIMAGKQIVDENAYACCPNESHPHWIDLGLSSGTLWQCCNEGASKPEGYGSYYKFDEAQAYNPPTLDQSRELLDKCTSVWTTLNGVNGRKFTGPSGGSIFLPAAGMRIDDKLDDVRQWGYYWSSTPFDENHASYFKFYWEFTYWYNDGNCNKDGLSVRPVR